MEQENNGELEALNEEETIAPETIEEEVVEEEQEVEEIDWESRAKKAEELANNYKIRAEKAEKDSKKSKDTPKSEQLSPKDLIALTRANIHEDDIAEVQEYAKFKGLSLADALNSPVVKNILNEKNEQRKTSQASNVGASKRSSSQVSVETLIANANKGIMPDNDEDMARLIEGRRGRK